MSDFIHVAGWAQHNHPHLRSFSSSSSIKTISKPPRPVAKSNSASALRTMATVANAPGTPTPRLGSYNDEEREMSTIPDPRSRAITPANDKTSPSPSHHPDLSNEVAALSTKLINAINHQTNLDDTLSATRQELEAAQGRVDELERSNAEHLDLVARGILIRKSTSDLERIKINAALAEERRQKSEVEKEKKKMEQELENLTAALFEEANKMVITAREEAQKEQDIVQKRNDQLKAQLADTELLLTSQHEQLTELKRVMEQMTVERDDQTNPTAPSTPGLSKSDSKEELHERDTALPSSIPEIVTPSYPTSFVHLLHPVLRTDLSAFDDFTSLLRMSKNVPNSSRVSSGSYGSIGLGLGLGAYVSPTGPLTNSSTSSLPAAAMFGSTPVTPTTPASSTSATSNNGPNSLTPLKETKFYKRTFTEDIEPTLRLDASPGLSWLARRNVTNAVCEGTLVVEPMPTATKHYGFPCSLCGESRKGAIHSRSYRFRINESENAQRYPLCKYCLGRVRSTCDFLGFLRILKDGHWRAEDEESEKSAWEETVRLREQMFWCRVGGGVVPVQHNNTDLRSPRVSDDGRKERERQEGETIEHTEDFQPKNITPVTGYPTDVSIKTASESVTRIDKAEGPYQESQGAAGEHGAPESLSAGGNASDSNEVVRSDEIQKDRLTTRDSVQSRNPEAISPPLEEKDEVKRLSITIPGSFQ